MVPVPKSAFHNIWKPYIQITNGLKHDYNVFSNLDSFDGPTDVISMFPNGTLMWAKKTLLEILYFCTFAALTNQTPRF